MKTALGVLLIAASIASAQDTSSVAASIGTSAAITAHVSTREFYISPNGSDTNSGSKERPFATLEGARDAVRSLKKASGPLQGGVTIWVAAGTYALSKTFTLESQDSGTPGSPIVYRACPGEKPILTGGRSITGFVPYKGDILKANVRGFKEIYFRQLFLDGKRQILARYPNADAANPISGGWAYVEGASLPMYEDIPGEDKHTFHLKAEDLHHWSHPEEGEVFIYPRFNWWNNIVGIKSLDESTRTITLAKDSFYAVRPNDRYFIQNLFEELDSPGEWYLEKTNSILYFLPPSPLKGKTLTAPAIKTLVHLDQGTSEVTFRGLTLECCGGTAVELKETTNCLIAGCTLRNIGDIGGNAITVSAGCNNGVVGNDISEIGRSGIQLSGGDRITLTPAGNYADNNHIHHIGIYYKQGVGVDLSGCGNRASHNLIHDGPRFGILFMGNNHLIEYNHLHHLSLETEDTGAIYSGGGDWISARGTILRYNFIHDIAGFGQEKGKWVTPFFAWGIYLDDNTCGVDVIGNVVARCSRSCLHLHNGRDNLIENNIFVEGGKEQVTYSGWISINKDWTQLHDDLVKGYDSIKNQPAWKGMRNIRISPDESVLTNGMVMIGNQFFCNIIDYRGSASKLYQMRDVPFDHNAFDYNLVSHHGLPVKIGIHFSDTNAPQPPDTWEGWQQLGNDRHSVTTDPLFVDTSKDDYRISPESPAYLLGFKQIPFDKIGPYADELRASWPIREGGQ